MHSMNQYEAINYIFWGKMQFQTCKYLVMSLGLDAGGFTAQSKVDRLEIWSFVKCGFLSFSCISQFVNIEII